jgi:hypothetical protein
MSTRPTDADNTHLSEALASAKLIALRALLEITSTSTNETERRYAATAILRTPDPDAPPPARSQRRREPDPYYAAPAPQPAPAPATHVPPDTITTPHATRDIDRYLQLAQALLDQHGIDPAADDLHIPPNLPDLPDILDLPDPADLSDGSLPKNAPAILAAAAGQVAQRYSPVNLMSSIQHGHQSG